ncbi:Bacteroides conjugative transposon TraK protein [Chitinophaga eiseniae]|uniref:Bacteroides conjugative transposon TraK protein n=1 Tax=Chitinophaga eiseniae TaxID=634771 RepID=A0A1T4MMS1_9BACT|nr:conjugative transposon protein TraK [Chitinophaga eiseniae]SJZ68369.1 Bacteroides conjugative transposon TraK protein [Chitinophaga eiseniae]
MFRQLKNIDSAFRYIRGFTIAVIVGNTLLSCFFYYQSYQLAGKVQGKIYVLYGDKVIEAFADDRKNYLPVEARAHVKDFHRLFFTLDPDDKLIQSNISKAMYLADASAREKYQSLKEGGFYTGVISGNVSQRIEVDSVNVDFGKKPYYFRCYATLQIRRPTSITTRSLITEGYLQDAKSTDNNPHGFLILHWTTIRNEDLNVVNR